MPNLSLSIPHQLSRADARQRVQQLVVQLQQQYGGGLGHVEQRWNGDTMQFTITVMAAKITGAVLIEDKAVRVDVDLPWPLAMLAGNVQETIEHEGRKLLGHQ